MWFNKTLNLGVFVVAAAYGQTSQSECVSVTVNGAPGIHPTTLAMAKETATRLFAEVGVSVELNYFVPRKAGSCVAIALGFDASSNSAFHPGALAYAEPFRNGGTQIHVFTDRIVMGDRRSDGKLLGYVIAHEIGHVLELISRHSAGGIMKANWRDADYSEIRSGRLHFAPEDAQLIHQGFARRKAAAAVLTANSR